MSEEPAKKILLVDDDCELCSEVAEILISEGYSVDQAYDGNDGQEMITSGGYDLIILDLKIPGKGGLEVLKEAKTKNPDLKIFIATGSQIFKTRLNEQVHFDKNKQDVILQYADGILSKPFSIETLLVRISAFLVNN